MNRRSFLLGLSATPVAALEWEANPVPDDPNKTMVLFEAFRGSNSMNGYVTLDHFEKSLRPFLRHNGYEIRWSQEIVI